jgi:hypothetical protein
VYQYNPFPDKFTKLCLTRIVLLDAVLKTDSYEDANNFAS